MTEEKLKRLENLKAASDMYVKVFGGPDITDLPWAAKELEQSWKREATMRETLEFYAKREIWGNGCAAIDMCDTYFTYEIEVGILRGGVRALKALEECEKLK